MQYILFLFVLFACVFTANAKSEVIARGSGCEFIDDDELLFKVAGQFSENGEFDLSLHASPSVFLMFLMDKKQQRAFAPCDLNVEITKLDPETSKVSKENITVSHNEVRNLWETLDTLFVKLAQKDFFEFESFETAKELVKDMKFIE